MFVHMPLSPISIFRVKQCVLVSLALLLAACSGGSDYTVTTTPVIGYVSKAPVTGATCKLYNSANQVIGTATTSVAGAIDFGKVSDVGAVYAQCVGGTYKDEATGLTVTNTTLTSGAVIVSGNSIKIVITPLTQLAFSRGGSSAANVAAQAKIIAEAFGLSDIDILAIDPTDLNTTAAGVDKAGRYGTMLAAIAQAMKDANLTLDALLTQLLAGVNNDGTQSAANVNFLKQAVANLTDATKNNNTAVRTNAAPAQTNVSTGLGAASGAASSVILSAANPSSFIQGAAGPANWALTGTGLTANMPITLSGTACSGTGTVNLAGTQLSGVNCSNVTAGAAATSIVLAVSNPATGNTSQTITLNVAPVPTLQFTLNPATMQLGSASGVTVAASSASSGAVSYSSGNTSVATIDASTGVVTTVGAGTTVITATQAAVTGLYSGATATYNLTVSAQTVPTLAFTNTSKSVTLGDADFTNAIATKTCATEAVYNPTVTYSSGTPASATVSSAGLVALKTAGSVVITANVPAVGTCAAGSQTYTITIGKATPTLAFSSPTTTATMGGTAPQSQATLTLPTNSGTGGTLPTSTGTLSYTSGTTATATVNGTGQISLVAAGTTLISANVAADSNYNAPTAASYTLTVSVPFVSPLPDTGITALQCYEASSNTLVGCTTTGAISLSPAQDGMMGKDVDTPLNTNGKLGFSYSTIGNFALTECVKDNITGLTWEGKSFTDWVRPATSTYTNEATAVSGSALEYVATVNSGSGLCGYTDWRLPTIKELQTLVDYGATSGARIDATWFPDTQAGNYWSSSPDMGDVNNAWDIDFATGDVHSFPRFANIYVRLVR